MWAQTVFVCLLIAVVSFGGSAVTSFYQILTDMGNVAATAPYIFSRVSKKKAWLERLRLIIKK